MQKNQEWLEAKKALDKVKKLYPVAYAQIPKRIN